MPFFQPVVILAIGWCAVVIFEVKAEPLDFSALRSPFTTTPAEVTTTPPGAETMETVSSLPAIAQQSILPLFLGQSRVRLQAEEIKMIGYIGNPARACALIQDRNDNNFCLISGDRLHDATVITVSPQFMRLRGDHDGVMMDYYLRQ